MKDVACVAVQVRPLAATFCVVCAATRPPVSTMASSRVRAARSVPAARCSPLARRGLVGLRWVQLHLSLLHTCSYHAVCV